MAPVTRPAGELAERDNGDENEADDEHPRDHLSPFLGGVLEERQGEEQVHRGVTLADPPAMGGKGLLDRFGIHIGLGSTAELRGRGRPAGAVVGLPFRPQV